MGSYVFDLKPPVEKKLDPNPTAEEIFNDIVPWLGAENCNPIFAKYGYTYSHIGDQWIWKVSVDQIPQEDIWVMAALSYRYWENSYHFRNQWYEYQRALIENDKFIKANPRYVKNHKEWFHGIE